MRGCNRYAVLMANRCRAGFESPQGPAFLISAPLTLPLYNSLTWLPLNSITWANEISSPLTLPSEIVSHANFCLRNSFSRQDAKTAKI